jgi:hypothetical protein
MLDLKELRKVAESATSGEWRVKLKGNSVQSHSIYSQQAQKYICSNMSTKSFDAEFIATCNPQTVLDLLDHIDKLTAINNNLEKIVFDAIQRIREGLGAGGNSTGMYVEVELGSVILDGITDVITEEFDKLKEATNENNT